VLGPTLKPTARRRNKHILVCVDQATRFTQLFALKNLQTQTLTDVFVNQLFARFGVPKSLVYDQQSALTNVLFQNVLKEMKVESKIAHTAYHTRTGLAERHVRTVSGTLKAYIHNPDYCKNWDTTLNYIAFNMNQVAFSTLGFSPHQLVYGKNLRSEIDELRDRF